MKTKLLRLAQATIFGLFGLSNTVLAQNPVDPIQEINVLHF